MHLKFKGLRPYPSRNAASYQQALQVWRTPEDVNAWIGARFEYDRSRAMLLSETQRSRSGQLPIYQPQEFFAAPSGVCVDLSRFAVETLRHIDPDARASYLMIEFAPVTIGGNTLRMHWLASFTRDGKVLLLCRFETPRPHRGSVRQRDGVHRRVCEVSR